jgi:predicted dehydrogenase
MPIEISLLGCGHPHIPDLLGVIASEPDLRLAAAWDADRSAIPGAVSSHAVAEAETAIRRADAVVICAPTDQRPALCVQVGRAGRPMLVQTPAALTAAHARAVAREIERSRTPALPLLFVREVPALGRLRSALRSGLLGRLAAVSATYAQAWALDGALAGPAAWMLDPRRAGVGALGDLAFQLLDGLAALDELPRLAAVVLDRASGGAGDLGGVGLGTWGGLPLNLHTSWVTRPGGLELSVTGALGSAALRDGVLELTRDDGSAERWIGAPPDPGEALRAFAERIRSRRLPRAGLAGAVAAHEVLEGAAVLG